MSILGRGVNNWVPVRSPWGLLATAFLFFFFLQARALITIINHVLRKQTDRNSIHLGPSHPAKKVKI